MQFPWLHTLDLASAMIFATTGALVASRKQMDVIGFMWLAVITGVGGGTVRDLLLGVPVFWVQSPAPVIACSVTAVVLHFTAHFAESRYIWILWLDAAGMALVTVVGTSKALALGTPAFVAMAMGVITASFGGIVRDVIGQEPSIVLRREIYVTAALAGSVVLVVLVRIGLPLGVAMLVAFATALLIRILAIVRGWTLPVYRSTPGRTLEDINSMERNND